LSEVLLKPTTRKQPKKKLISSMNSSIPLEKWSHAAQSSIY
jgi:hypothetical protein